MSYLPELIFLLVIFLTNIVQSISGFAGTVIAMPFSLLLVGADVAKPILNAVALFVTIWIAIKFRKNIDWKDVFKMIIFMGIGFGLGFLIPKSFSEHKMILKFYGLLITLIAVFFATQDIEKLHIPDWILYFILIFAGLIHNQFVSGGPLVVIYARLKIKDKNTFRASLSFIWVILNSILLVSHITTGLFDLKNLIIVVISLATGTIATVIGIRIASKINLEWFMKITYLLLFISGFILLV